MNEMITENNTAGLISKTIIYHHVSNWSLFLSTTGHWLRASDWDELLYLTYLWNNTVIQRRVQTGVSLSCFKPDGLLQFIAGWLCNLIWKTFKYHMFLAPGVVLLTPLLCDKASRVFLHSKKRDSGESFQRLQEKIKIWSNFQEQH